MILTIEHYTHYSYENEVFLDPHYLRFLPAVRSYIQLKSFKISVSPTSDGLSQRIDVENNSYYQSWFSDLHKTLEIRSEIKVKVEPYNPFDFLREEIDFLNRPEFQLYLNPLTNPSQGLKDWAETQRETFGADYLTLIGGINREISQKWSHKIRYQSSIMDPNECFEGKEASCRDLCWMMMAVLRHLKIPTRFVSGYAFNPDMETGHELHSWVEAWISGAGWVGFDPVSGLLCGHHYIPVCASYHPKNTMPVSGSFRGNSKSTMKTEVKIIVKN